jgi:hypothetical protein
LVPAYKFTRRHITGGSNIYNNFIKNIKKN